MSKSKSKTRLSRKARTEQLRAKNEIIQALDRAADLVWLSRHQMHPPKEPDTLNDIVEGARKAAARVLADHSTSLGELTDHCAHNGYTDFEWGLVSGKLSALRWVMGDEWDNLNS